MCVNVLAYIVRLLYHDEAGGGGEGESERVKGGGGWKSEQRGVEEMKGVGIYVNTRVHQQSGDE